jgi:hypothetical protein
MLDWFAGRAVGSEAGVIAFDIRLAIPDEPADANERDAPPSDAILLER